jgi:hypothetical protein
LHCLSEYPFGSSRKFEAKTPPGYRQNSLSGCANVRALIAPLISQQQPETLPNKQMMIDAAIHLQQ